MLATIEDWQKYSESKWAEEGYMQAGIIIGSARSPESRCVLSTRAASKSRQQERLQRGVAHRLGRVLSRQPDADEKLKTFLLISVSANAVDAPLLARTFFRTGRQFCARASFYNKHWNASGNIFWLRFAERLSNPAGRRKSAGLFLDRIPRLPAPSIDDPFRPLRRIGGRALKPCARLQFDSR